MRAEMMSPCMTIQGELVGLEWNWNRMDDAKFGSRFNYKSLAKDNPNGLNILQAAHAYYQSESDNGTMRRWHELDDEAMRQNIPNRVRELPAYYSPILCADPLRRAPDALLRISRLEHSLPLTDLVINIAALIDFSNHSFALLCKDYSNKNAVLPECRVFYFQYYFQSEKSSPRPVPEYSHLEECLKMYIYTIEMAQEPKEIMEEALGLGLRVKSRVRWEKVKRKTKKQWAKSISQIKKDTDPWCVVRGSHEGPVRPVNLSMP